MERVPSKLLCDELHECVLGACIKDAMAFQGPEEESLDAVEPFNECKKLKYSASACKCRAAEMATQ